MAAIQSLVCVSNLYKYVKQNSRPLRSAVCTIDGAIAIIVSPIYEKLKGVPDHPLVFLDGKVVLDFADSSHDLIVVADASVVDLIKNIAAQCGVDFDEATVLFKGIGHSINSANSLVLKVLSASPSAYSTNPSSKLSNPPLLIRSVISLVSVLQARNNAQFMITGSLDMFSNRLLRSDVQKAGNPDKLVGPFAF